MTLVPLVRRSLRRARGLLIALAAVLSLFQVLIVLAASYVSQERGFAQMTVILPPIVQQMLGGILSSFGAMVAFGYFHPIVIIVFVGVAIVIATEPAADVESGVVDLVLARPVRRTQLIERSIIMLAGVTSSLAALMVASSWLSLRFVAPPGSGMRTAVLLKLAVNLVAVSWALGGMALAAAAAMSRRGTAVGSVAILGLVLYLVNLLGEILPAVRPYVPLSPFHYYQPMGIVTGLGTRWGSDVMLLAGVAAVFSGLAFAAFSRRDL
jgi:ABC-2 type transport system permease protein